MTALPYVNANRRERVRHLKGATWCRTLLIRSAVRRCFCVFYVLLVALDNPLAWFS